MVILCATAGRCHHALTLIAYGSLVGASTPSGLAYARIESMVRTVMMANMPSGVPTTITVEVGIEPGVVPHMAVMISVVIVPIGAI